MRIQRPLHVLLATLLACGGDAPTAPAARPTLGPPAGDPSLVVALTMIEKFEHYEDRNGTRTLVPGNCWLTLATLDGRIRPLDEPCGIYAAWSPDGKRLVHSAKALRIVDADGTNGHAIPNTTFSFGDPLLVAPSWSPDGKQLSVYNVSTGTLGVIDTAGTGYRELKSTLGHEIYNPATWSPDGKSLLYARDRTLWEVDVATDVSRQIIDPKLPLIWGARYSPDGSRVAFLDPLDGTQYVVGPFGTGQQPGPLPPDAGLWVANRDGTGLRHLLHEVVANAAWSPDGSRLLVRQVTRGKPTGLFIVAADGQGTPQPLLLDTDSLMMSGGAWAPKR